MDARLGQCAGMTPERLLVARPIVLLRGNPVHRRSRIAERGRSAPFAVAIASIWSSGRLPPLLSVVPSPG